MGSTISQVVSYGEACNVGQKASSWSHSEHEDPSIIKSEKGYKKGQEIPDDLVLPCGADVPAWPSGVTASDSEGSPLEITTNQSVRFTPCGGKEYTRSWIANDRGQLITIGTQRISFLDKSAPIIKVPSDIIVQTTNAVPFPSYEATDNGCSTFQIFFQETEIDMNSPQYRLIRKWTAVDGCGNTSSAKQSISVEQSLPKQIRNEEKKNIKS